MNKHPKVSIITIVYNAANDLKKTINSIAAQSYKNIEYIIIDGASTDGTLDMIKNNRSAISKLISEKDDGIYDAMNKGIKLSEGDYLWFINAGDEIATEDTLSKVMTGVNNADIYYGDTIMIDKKGNKIGKRRLEPPTKLSWRSFKKGMLVSHQSFIVKKSIVDLYNLNYKFSADFEWCLIALKRAKHIVNTELVLSLFLDGGITKQNIKAGLKERFKIMTKYYGLLPTLYEHIFISIKFFWYRFKNGRF